MIPPEKSSEFVANMENVLDIYKRPYDVDNPLVCMDESPKQLIESKNNSPMIPGYEKREDYEYIRHGVVNIFMANEPLKSKRLVEVTQTKTKKDWAMFVKRIADEMYPEAKRIWDRFEFVYTPKHGSWLNMAEIELHILNHQCLNRHISKVEDIISEVDAWQKHRNDKNGKNGKINWQFTTNDARQKLRRLYPSIYS